jgi:hypothetical protein
VGNLFGLLWTLAFSLPSSEAEKGFELGIMEFSPSLDFGEGGDIADESEENEGEEGGKGMGLSLCGAGIGNFFQAADEMLEKRNVDHENLRE